MTYGLISFIMMEKNPREEGRDRVSDVWVTSELEHDRDSGSEMDIVDVESEQAGTVYRPYIRVKCNCKSSLHFVIFLSAYFKHVTLGSLTDCYV